MAKSESAEKAIKDIRRRTRRRFSAEEKIRIVMEGMRGEDSVTKEENGGDGWTRTIDLGIMSRLEHDEEDE